MKDLLTGLENTIPIMQNADTQWIMKNLDLVKSPIQSQVKGTPTKGAMPKVVNDLYQYKKTTY